MSAHALILGTIFHCWTIRWTSLNDHAYALTTHVKDMGLEPYPDGFLLSEVRLGEGVLDLPRMFTMVRQARPKTNFVLEMITRRSAEGFPA